MTPPRTTTARAVAVGVVMVVLLVASGCSTGSLDEDVQVGAPDAETPVADQPADDDRTTTTSTLRTTTSADTAGHPDQPTYECPLTEVDALMDDAFDLPPQDVDVDAVVAAFDQLATAVPADLAPDVRTLRDAVADVLTRLESLDGQDPMTMGTGQIEQLGAAFAAFDAPEVQAASARLEAFFRTMCPEEMFGGSQSFEPGVPD